MDVNTFEIKSGDVYLLCSDGLSGMIDKDIMEQILIANADLEESAQALIRAANEAGGHDNISLILIRMLEDESGLDE